MAEEVWVVRVVTTLPHPGPCGHAPEIGCLNTQMHNKLAIFRNRDAALAYATHTYNVEDDEWVSDGSHDNYYFVVRSEYGNFQGRPNVCIREQFIDVLTADFEPDG